ncbi:hypothetical protein ABZ920_00815 [Streptomyces sp. NPDC046831]
MSATKVVSRLLPLSGERPVPLERVLIRSVGESGASGLSYA